jgi:hypothetical protein
MIKEEFSAGTGQPSAEQNIRYELMRATGME